MNKTICLYVLSKKRVFSFNMLLFIKSISYLRFHFQICIIFVFLILGSVEETDFHIEPEIALELAMAANYLDA